MGTWDIGFFDNDMACDWENEISSETGLDYIKDALQPVLTSQEEELDIDIANKALAAAEALAKLQDKDGEHSSYTENLDAWVEQFSESVPTELNILAKEAIEKILSPDSELLQFWRFRGEYQDWLENIEKLKERLKS